MTNGGTSADGPGVRPGRLGWDLGVVAGSYQSRMEAALDGTPGGLRGFLVLSTVAYCAPPNQQALGAHLGIDRTVLTYLIDALGEAGEAERIPDPADRRARKVVATAAGRARLAACEKRIAAEEAALLSGLEPDDAELLRTLLHRLAGQAHRPASGSNPCASLDAG
ncbi:winged helix-turn-helix transcriptional regulator [Arthrobacter gandavensis]|uniref:MarR family winged helix-turn-helix transcriptional regulator n=1 Tax=Arthrobacter gandavensis TaxID=169960 RepID=UPI0018901049|nr:MarR family winged helix-turn-helix transcriptional regulator [Arthrobacter gandavensis]MBF4992590.1 winged helix-turn-helix transcriptional regulator [Arthrobacter gandavensis]